VQDAVVRFAAFDIGCLAVVDDSQKLVGLFSEGDYIKRVASVGKDSSTVALKDVCTHAPNILIAKPDDSLEQCMSKMHFKNIRHLIIVENMNIKGLISIKDLFRETIIRNELLIKRLSNLYIGKGAFFGSE
jgi:CBS domain-containing protein